MLIWYIRYMCCAHDARSNANVCIIVLDPLGTNIPSRDVHAKEIPSKQHMHVLYYSITKNGICTPINVLFLKSKVYLSEGDGLNSTLYTSPLTRN